MAGKRVKLSSVRPGDRVEVEFDDHSQESEGTIHFIVIGVVLHRDRKSIRIGNWVYADPLETEDGNCGWYDLATGAVREIRQLR